MNIYVGNLAKEITQEELQEVFGAFGQVASIAIIRDKFSGESRGFGFVEMPVKSEAEAAMNGIKDIKGRMVTVNEARPREPSRGGRSGGFGRKHGGGRERRGAGGWR